MERRVHLLAYGLFIASGAMALVYEVTWFRNLSLIFGASFEATSIVLAAYMGGMSLGGFCFGRLATRFARPLRVYGLLELGVAVFALALPMLLRGVDALYVWAATGDGDPGVLLSLFRVVMAYAVLAVPTFFMGGTLPVVMRLLVREDAQFGVRLSWLYGSNTLGAVIGTLLAGFVLIPALGVWQTQLCAVVAGLAIGAVSLWIDRGITPLPVIARGSTAAPESVAKDEVPSVAPGDTPAVLRWVFWGTAIGGFGSLALEVLWTRAITIAVGSSTYSFSVMLAAFLMGIALGSAFHALAPFRRVSIGTQFGVVALLAGGFSLVVSSWIPRLPQLAIELNLALYGDLARIRPVTAFLLAFAIMLVPCFFMGIAFPLANQARARLSSGYATSVGETLGLNTLGSIGGSLGAGFFMIPVIGLQTSMLFAASLFMLYGVWVLGAVARARNPARGGVLAVATLLAMGLVIAIPSALRPSGSTQTLGAFSNNQLMQYVDAEGRVDVEAQLEHGRVLYYREGRSATVSVLEQDGYRSLSVNGKIVASDDPLDLRTQYMLAHVPILLHPDPRSALIVGMGAGTTLGGVTAHEGLDAIALAEIEPAMLGAEPFFAESNGSPLSDPRLRVYLEDGRNYLKTTTRRFDVITADPIHPWNRGSGYLYTEDYYRLAADRLAPGGVICQWLPVADLTPEDFKSVVATFARVFPHVTLWHSTAAILIGSDAPLEIRPEELVARSRSPRVVEQLETLGLREPLSFLAELQLSDPQIRRYVEGAVINTDDNLYLEFASPLAIGREGLGWEVIEELHGYGADRAPLPEGDPAIPDLEALKRAKSRTILAEIALQSMDRRQRQAALQALRQILDRFPDYRPPAMIAADHLALRAGALLDAGRIELALRDASAALSLVSDHAEASRARGNAWLEAGRTEEALLDLERARRLQPRHWRSHALYSRALWAASRREEALEVLREGIRVHPAEPGMRARLEEWERATGSGSPSMGQPADTPERSPG